MPLETKVGSFWLARNNFSNTLFKDKRGCRNALGTPNRNHAIIGMKNASVSSLIELLYFGPGWHPKTFWKFQNSTMEEKIEFNLVLILLLGRKDNLLEIFIEM